LRDILTFNYKLVCPFQTEFILESISMKSRSPHLALMCAVGLILFQKNAVAQATNDLWDVSGGTIITTNSGAGSSALENIFGGTLSSPEPGTAFFRDDRSAGFVHFVEWKTPGLVKLTGFQLKAVDDGASSGGRRGFSEFRLYARDPLTQTFQLISSYTPTNPYPLGDVDLVRNVTPLVAQEFRAEFVQFFAGSFPGPRIVELDGFGEDSVCLPAPQNFLSWWRGENNALDSRGLSHGALLNGVQFTNGIGGQAFQFDGVNDRVVVPDVPAYSFSGGVTVAGWFQTTNTPDYASLVDKFEENAANDTGFQISFGGSNPGSGEPGTLRADFGIGTNYITVFSTNFVADGLWHHFAATCDGSNTILYIDGEPSGAAASPQILLDNDLPITLGQDTFSSSRHYRGLLDEVALFNRALSSNEIAGILSAGPPGFCAECASTPPGLVSWWRGDSNALDSVSGFNGTFANGSFAPGIVRDAFRFSGTEYVEIPDVAPLDFSNAFTIELWVSPTAAGNADGTTFFLAKGNVTFSNTQSYGILFDSNRQALIRLGNGSGIDQLASASALPLNSYSHVAVSYDGNEMRVYVNGALENSKTTSIGTLLNTSEGLVTGGADFQGGKVPAQATIDEVSIYDRALAPQEIAAIYAASSAGKCVSCASPPSGIVSWWRAESNAADSVSTNNGTFSGETGFAPGEVGMAFSFDGTNDEVVPSTAEFAAVSNSFTMEMWVLPTEGRGSVPENADTQGGINTGQRYAVFPSHGDIEFGSGQAGAGISIGTNGVAVFEHAAFYIPAMLVYDAPILDWTHIAVVYTSNRPSLYINGQLAHTGLQSARSVHPGSEMGGGVYGHFAGLMDEYTIYNRALNLSEIARIYNAGSSGKCVPIQPLQLAPAETNVIVGQSLAFNATGGEPPQLFSLVTNNSGGSINAFSGIYVAGPIAGVIDTVRVTDARGSNVTAIINVLPDLTPRPDLAIQNISAPANIDPGVPFELTWVVTNRGTAAASAPWTERVFVSDDDFAGNDSFLGEFSIATPLNAGDSVTRTQLVTIPLDGDAGALRFVVFADSASVVNESNEANNVGVSLELSEISFLLTLNSSVTTLSEGQIANFSVTRNGNRSGVLLVNLLSSDSTELGIPAGVTIPANAASATFSASALPDGIFDGEQSVTLIAGANGFPNRMATVFVTDSDIPHLFLTVSTNQITEGGTIQAIVSRELVTSAPLVVAISGGQGQLAFPGFVTIPASTNSVAFDLIALGDTFVEPTNTYSLTASSAGFQSATISVSVADDDLPNVAVALSLHTISENAGANAITATATRDRNSPRALSIALSSSDTNIARVPALITIPASQTNVSFPIAIINNDNVDGTRNVAISGAVLSSVGNLPLRPAQSDTLAVTDDDGPALKLTLARNLVGEGLIPATTGTVSRNTGNSGPLSINLSSSDTGEATVPLSVLISDGSNSVSFPITSVNDGTNDGNQSLTIDAASAGFAPASAALVVSDTDLPDLIVTSLTTPTNAVTGQQISVTFRIENQGLSTAGTNFLQRVFLSSDPQAGDDTIVSQASFNGSIPVGQFFEQTLNILLPQTPGDYWLVVAADANNQVLEGLENNNSRVTALPITVAKAYSATVSASPKTAPAGTPILLSGHATRTLNGQPAAFEIVSVHLSVRGTKRILSALTDANGNYAVTFKPLPGEAGVYSVAADHPGISDPSAQDGFTLLGLRVPTQPLLNLVEGKSATNTTIVENLSDLSLSGLSAEVLNGPTNLTLDIQFGATTLAGNGTISLKLIVTAPPGSGGGGVFHVRLSSAEGASAEFDLPVFVESLVPRLTVSPLSLSAGMRRGSQTSVELSVTNNGGAASGPVSTLLPALPWISVSTGAQIASLAPGEGALITLLLTPPADLPLGDHTGSLAINATNTGVTVPFTFRSLSDNTGILKLSAVDELTFYAEGSPKLTNASVRLSVPETGETVLATNFNGLNELLLTNILEAHYTLRIDAPDHEPYQATFLVKPAQTNEVIAFLSRQSVRYTWTVTPVTIEDRYEIVVETTFETAVPIPVITVEPSIIDVTDFPGETKQVDLKITNHGLLAAQGAHLSFDAHPNLAITPLIGDIGVLPAQSSLTIPVTLRKLSVAPDVKGKPKSAADENGGGDCSLGGKLEWKIMCAGQEITHVVPLKAINLNQIGVQCGSSAQAFFVSGGVPGGVNFAAIGGGLGNPGYTAPISFAEKSICDPCFQNVGGGLLENCLPLLPLPLFESPDNDECEEGAGTAEQLVACFQDALDQVKEKTSEPLDKLGELGDALGEDGEDLKDASDSAKNGIENVGDALNIARCLSPLLDPCITGIGGADARDRNPSFGILKAADANNSPTAPLIQRVHQVLAFVGGHTNLFGSDIWFRGTNIVAWTNWINAFTARMNMGTENNSHISPTERAELLALPFPEPVSSNDVTRLIDRWNRTVDYYNAGIFNRTNVPSGQSLDFIALDERREVLAAAHAAQAAVEAEGFDDVTHAYNLTRKQLIDKIFAQTEGVCAKVRLRLEQQAIISRDAFKATLEIENHTGTPLENIGVTLLVTDEGGNDRTPLFQIRPPVLNGISSVDGAGIQPASTTGSSSWLLVPSSLAAPTNRARYFVSGTLTYRQDGTTLTIPLAPTAIDVLPNPKLVLDYFHERDVFSDDPFTPEIEPAIPYSLAVRVRNEGFGSANNFRITSAQPKIVENEKGLLINFEIIATEVGGVGLTPALTANFGNIAPGSTVVGRWLFRSSLQGLFTDYNATFEHVSGLGDRRLSLIDSVNIHEMIHLVQADGAFEDGAPDFLVNDVPDLDDLPDTLFFSNGSNAPVSVVLNATNDAPVSPGHLTVQLTSTMPAGWTYLRVPDPADANHRLVEVRRADNSLVTMDKNVWRTDRTFIGFGHRPLRENILHLLDFNGSGNYTLVYESASLSADTNAPSSAVSALSSASPATFQVTWSGNDDANGSGIAFFDIFVSANGGAFTNWLARTSGTGAIFQGVPGVTYAFYSRATDSAGNVEAAPASADAETSTSIINTQPILESLPDLTVNEGETVSLTVEATDADDDVITYSFGAPVPSGMVLNAQSGKITWITGESHGPSTNEIQLIARDNGVPALSATQSFLITVLESNTPPALVAIPNFTNSENALLTFTNFANDSDLPLQRLSFSLGNGVPEGATVNSTNGIFTWKPTEIQGGTTNTISVIVTDDGPPSLSATQTFSVVVLDTQPDFRLNIGTTALLSGATTNVPLQLHSGVDLTNLHLVLAVSGERLTNLNLSALAPKIVSANISFIGSNRFDLRFESAANAPLQGDFVLAQLGFATISNEHSTIVRLSGESVIGSSVSSTSPLNGAAGTGRIFIVGAEPILDATVTNQQLALMLYALPGENYALESRNSFDLTVPWIFDSMTNAPALRTDFPVRLIAASSEFFRAYRVTQNALSVSLQNGKALIEWPLDCVDCVLEESNDVGTDAIWTPSADQPEIVNGRYRVLLASANAQRFYRLRKPQP
jgi:hypothetical protein